MPNKTTSWPWTLPFRQSIPQHRRAVGKQLLELIAFWWWEVLVLLYLCDTCQCLCRQGSATLFKKQVKWVKIPFKKKLLGRGHCNFFGLHFGKIWPKKTLVTISINKRWQFYIIKMVIHFWRNVKVIGICYIHLYIKIYIRKYVHSWGWWKISVPTTGFTANPVVGFDLFGAWALHYVIT